MNRTRTLAPLLGLSALAAALFSDVPAVQAQTVTVTNLNPADYTGADATGVSGKFQVGSGALTANPNNVHALLWSGTPGSVVDLHPAGFLESYASGVSGDTQVGAIYASNRDGNPTAALWHGTAASVVSLATRFENGSYAYAVSDDSQVGYTFSIDDYEGTETDTALLWHGTADSAVELGASGFDNTIASGVSGDTQVGYGYDNYNTFIHALLWHATTASTSSAVDLQPAGYAGSAATGVSGDTQVGDVFLTIDSSGFQDNSHAALWHGTAASFVDLHPKGVYASFTAGAADGAQVGYALVGSDTSFNSINHAVLWRGTAASALDLNTFLPGEFIRSQATGVSGSDGVYDVVGTASSANQLRAVLWHVVFTPPVLSSLVPASRTEGRGDFPLTVIGKGFGKLSVVKWNGAAQHTVYISPTQLAASIPTALIAAAGTAKVTVSNGVVASNSRTETINPRPVISSLSPATRAEGDVFTLTVTGTSFLPQSRVKADGTEITTTYVSSTKLTAVVPQFITFSVGSHSITVTTPQVATSGAKALTIK